MAYSKKLGEILRKAGAEVGSTVAISRKDGVFEGLLLRHGECSDPDVVVIKMGNGYNMGFRIGEGDAVKVLAPPAKAKPKVKSQVKPGKDAAKIAVIGTGGTISASADGESGALGPTEALDELLDSVPGLREGFEIESRQPFAVFSEDMGPSHWKKLAEEIIEAVSKDVSGVVVTHGTDTMGYSVAALSFMLGGIGKPVVFTGAQRSPDRPSSDAFGNILAAARYCATGKPGVYVLMHSCLHDGEYALFEGTRARKNHTSRRDAFKAPNVGPYAVLDSDGKATYLYEKTEGTVTKPSTKLENSVALVKFYPGMTPSDLESIASGKKGIVLEGTGLGHVSNALVDTVGKIISKGTLVAMASQCGEGTVDLHIYNTGRSLMNAGVIPLSDMLAETAYAKMCWVLANSKDPAKDMAKPLAGECAPRREVL